ncbi:alpha/beta fold hydrolase [Flavobacterium sp.]|uniref:alpha/beta fold hydrolase n=1 Tax=Flavobacterium sp. TaxID=239 RepID=UPI003750D768
MIFLIIGCFSVILFIILLWYSPGKIEPYLNENNKPILGSVSEKTFVKIGGVTQGMFIKSKNSNNPVLLYVHGGPGFPNYFLVDKYKPNLEDYFTVCYWEQRGGGLSYSSEVTLESINFNQLSSDAIEVANYLRKRFSKEKIYIMAHSGGTPIALLAVLMQPELFQAYIGMAQISNQSESEKMAYKYILNKYEKDRNQKRIRKLKKYPVLQSDANILSFYKSKIRDQYMHELGIGTMHKMKSVFLGVFIPVWTCKAYTISEKINIWKSKFSFLPKTNLINEMLKTDFTTKVPKLDIPVYFFSGKYDLTVNINLSKAYLKKLDAPLKGFYTFNNSAHSPLFEEPELVRKIFENDILKNNNSLADKTLKK